MAYTESGELSPNSSYTLGEYIFTLQNVVSEGERVIQAHLSGPEGNAAHGITVPTSARVESWRVEANETEASVYVQINGGGSGGINAVNWNLASPINNQYLGDYYNTNIIMSVNGRDYMLGHASEPTVVSLTIYNNMPYAAIVSGAQKGGHLNIGNTKGTYVGLLAGNNKYVRQTYYANNFIGIPTSTVDPAGKVPVEPIQSGEYLLARFAIDLQEADPGGWIDPGDYDPDWEQGDPTYTLHLDVIGALSGRHNDPIYNPSYSYLPADKATVKQYGSGGDGGHGGGGGAGASTIVVYKFATSRADGKEIVCKAKRHGYGSGGGKGGKGGDGCILVYY